MASETATGGPSPGDAFPSEKVIKIDSDPEGRVDIPDIVLASDEESSEASAGKATGAAK